MTSSETEDKETGSKAVNMGRRGVQGFYRLASGFFFYVVQHLEQMEMDVGSHWYSAGREPNLFWNECSF